MRPFLLFIILSFVILSLASITITSLEYLTPRNIHSESIDAISSDNSHGAAYEIEECYFDKKLFYVKGWIALQGMPNEILKLDIIITDGEKTYLGKTGLFFRWDLQDKINKIFNDKLPYGKTGFASRLLIKNIDHGNHDFFIRLDNKKVVKIIPIGCKSENQ